MARCDGRDDAPALIAFRGRVYDVSRSYHWRRGRHWAQHRAGQDLTDALAGAPHGESLLARFPLVGLLVDADTTA